MTISKDLMSYIDSNLIQAKRIEGQQLVIGNQLRQFCQEIEKLENLSKAQEILLSNLNIMAKLNPILAIVLRSTWVLEEVKNKVTLLIDRIITSILQSEEITGI